MHTLEDDYDREQRNKDTNVQCVQENEGKVT